MKKRIIRVLVSILILLVIGLIKGFLSFFYEAPVLQYPVVSSSDPIAIPPEGAFVLEFSQRMNKRTVLKNIQINPDLPFRNFWEGRRLFIKPLTSLSPDTSLTLLLNARSTNLLGVPFQQSYRLSYEVSRDPSLVAVFPKTSDLKQDEKIIFIFSHPMDSEEWFAFSPKPPGQWEWVDQKTLVFTPKPSFPLSTRFTLTPQKPIKTLDGALVKGDFNFSFQTPRFAHVDIEKSELVVQPVFVRFNQPTDLSSFGSSLLIRDERGVPLRDIVITASNGDENRYALLPKQGKWPYGETFTVSIDARLMPKIGNLSLETPIAFSFQTESLIKEWRENASTKHIPRFQNKARFVLKESVSEASLQSALTFFPKLDVDVRKISDDVAEVLFQTPVIPDSIQMIIMEEPFSGFLRKPALFDITTVDPLTVTVEEKNDQLCLISNRTLKKVTVSPLLKLGEKNCFLETSLEPDTTQLVHFEAMDIFDQKYSLDKTVVRRTPKPEELVLESMESATYLYPEMNTPFILRFRSKDIAKITVKVCSLTTKDAVKKKCSKPEESFEHGLSPQWGETQDHALDLSPFLDTDTEGIWRIRINANTLSFEHIVIRGFLEMLTKRGDSVLVWLLDSRTGTPVEGASISFYSIYGALLQSQKTNAEGIFFKPSSRMKYEFVIAEKGRQKTILNIFDADDFQAGHFGIPQNASKNPYLLQWTVTQDSPDAISGVLLATEKIQGKFNVPRIRKAFITLLNYDQELLGEQAVEFDSSGKALFSIPLPSRIQTSGYQLGYCPGLSDCFSETIWTAYVPDKSSPDPSDPVYRSGETYKLSFSGLDPDRPALIMAERDTIFFQKVVFPKTQDFEISITSEMSPDVIVTMTQFQEQKIWVGARYLRVEGEWYPANGTSVITAGIRMSNKTLVSDTAASAMSDQTSEFSKIVIPAKKISLPDEASNFSNLRISKKLPSFLRRGDTAIGEFTIANSEPQSVNIPLRIGLSNLFVGIPSQKTKIFTYPLQIPDLFLLREFTIDLPNETIALPVITDAGMKELRQGRFFETKTDEEQLQFSFPTTGLWKWKIVISNSPLSFILDRFEAFLEKKEVMFVEELLKSAAITQFAALKTKDERQTPYLQQQLSYLQILQHSDGGFASAKNELSDPMITSSIALSLSILQDEGILIPLPLQNRLVSFLAQDLKNRSGKDPLDFFLLSGLSSLKKWGGLDKAMAWAENELSNSSLIFLLRIFENYRDAGYRDAAKKIEDILEIVKTRERNFSDERWMPSDENFSDFFITSMYLNALVRQKSARTSIPPLIRWLSNRQLKEQYQSMENQQAFLSAMMSYLKIYQEQYLSEGLSLEDESEKNFRFELVPSKKFQTFVLQDMISIETHSIEKQWMLKSDGIQPWFIALIAYPLKTSSDARNQGFSIARTIMKKENRVFSGTLSIIASEAMDHVMVINPIPGALGKTDPEDRIVLEKIPAGETVIPFEWTMEVAGTFYLPPATAYLISNPSVKGISKEQTIQVQ